MVWAIWGSCAAGSPSGAATPGGWTGLGFPGDGSLDGVEGGLGSVEAGQQAEPIGIGPRVRAAVLPGVHEERADPPCRLRDRDRLPEFRCLAAGADAARSVRWGAELGDPDRLAPIPVIPHHAPD